MKRTKICLECSEGFTYSRSTARYCCDSCRVNAWNKREKESATDEQIGKKEKNSASKIKVHPAAINLLTDATWDFAHNILWNGYPFSKNEIALAKIYIQEYYEEIPAEEFTATAHTHFSAYCERVLLAKEYVNRFSHRYIPHPCIWLNKLNPKGFAGTKKWYLENLERRKKIHRCPACEMRASIQHLFDQFDRDHQRA